jgi:hypothetical protein
MSTLRCLTALALALAGPLLVSSANGQQRLIRQVVGSGATAATSSQYLMLGTVGQTIIGRATSSSNVGALGFWYTYPFAYTTGADEGNAWEITGSTPSVRVAPNPVTDEARVTIGLPLAATISLTLYDGVGQERLRLLEGRREGGTITLHLLARNLASGDYTLVLVAGGFRVAAPIRVIN